MDGWTTPYCPRLGGTKLIHGTPDDITTTSTCITTDTPTITNTPTTTHILLLL